MRPSGAALQSFLISRVPCYRADLYTFTLASGTIYRWTDFDRNLQHNGNTYYAQYDASQNDIPLLTRSKIGVKNTVEVPELVINLYALDTAFVGGINIKTQMHNGFFDGATVELDRCAMPTPGDTSLGAPNLFTGYVGPIRITALGAEITVRGANRTMNQYVPRNMYVTSCLHSFCDTGCTLAKATYTITNTVGAGSTASLVKWGSAPGSPGLYTYGVLTMTSGAASGQVRTVKIASSGGIQLIYPLYNAPATGDTFSILQGCDKTRNSGSGQSCTDRSNTQHYRAFPYVPVGETAV